MTDNFFNISTCSRMPSVYELEETNSLRDDQPAFEQIQLHSLTRGDSGEKLRQRWQSFLRRFRKLKPVQTLVDHQPIWVSLFNLYVPAEGKAQITYKQVDNIQSGPELKILGSGFGGGLNMVLSEVHSFNAEGIGKSLQIRLLVTAIHYASDEGDDQVRLEAELPAEALEFRILDLPSPATPTAWDSSQWQILHKVNLTGANKGLYTWQRDKTKEANWKVDAGIPVPESLGVKLSWTLKLTRSESFSVKYEIPYGNEYIFYQPNTEILLAPLCSVSS